MFFLQKCLEKVVHSGCNMSLCTTAQNKEMYYTSPSCTCTSFLEAHYHTDMLGEFT